VGKGKISRELIPIWAGIDDEIVKAHYIGKLAGVLGVREEDVRAQLSKSPSFAPSASLRASEGREKKTRREVIEEYVVGLALRNGKVKELISEPVKQLFRVEFWKKITEQFTIYKVRFTRTKDLINNLPAELRERAEELLLVDDEMDAEEAEKEWQKALIELEEVGIREKIEGTRTSGQKDSGQLKKLTERLAELTKRS